jgi:pyridoxamine 5'-phosphate oxidase
MNFESIVDPLLTVDEFRVHASDAKLALPESMVLATVDPDGAPHARVVLYKGRSGRNIHFFTNYQSDKARDLEHEPRAEICIHYASLALQVRLFGTVQKLSRAASEAYFASRPRESQIGAWASRQSQPLASRAELDEAVASLSARFEGKAVPCPQHWGGFGLETETVELWVGQDGRLHDRARYRFDGERWQCQRLFP